MKFTSTKRKGGGGWKVAGKVFSHPQGVGGTISFGVRLMQVLEVLWGTNGFHSLKKGGGA